MYCESEAGELHPEGKRTPSGLNLEKPCALPEGERAAVKDDPLCRDALMEKRKAAHYNQKGGWTHTGGRRLR